MWIPVLENHLLGILEHLLPERPVKLLQIDIYKRPFIVSNKMGEVR